MILADTSIWIDHIRQGGRATSELLNHADVAIHPIVIGELACGNLPNRPVFLKLLKSLPQVKVALDSEVLGLIESKRLMGRGLGWSDAHLLASALITEGIAIWTRDVDFDDIANELKVGRDRG
jgi:predicted nucleic acid-binding protein